MATSMKEWRKEAMEKYGDVALQQMSHTLFFRDPPRAQHVDSSRFFSPADGVIISQARVAPDGDLVEAKGVNVTLADLMKPWLIDQPCLVIGIFLSFYDVHICRMPTSGILTNQQVDPIRTANLPMLFEESSIVKKGTVSKRDMKYMASNSRVLCKVSNTPMAYDYFMVLLADSDVNCILPFDHRKHAPLSQSQRSHVVRWGSQCNLILPLDPRYKFRALQKVTDHVEAGTDPLVSIERVC
jgi:phosphatidylserine decarboxylase